MSVPILPPPPPGGFVPLTAEELQLLRDPTFYRLTNFFNSASTVGEAEIAQLEQGLITRLYNGLSSGAVNYLDETMAGFSDAVYQELAAREAAGLGATAGATAGSEVAGTAAAAEGIGAEAASAFGLGSVGAALSIVTIPDLLGKIAVWASRADRTRDLSGTSDEMRREALQHFLEIERERADPNTDSDFDPATDQAYWDGRQLFQYHIATTLRQVRDRVNALRQRVHDQVAQRLHQHVEEIEKRARDGNQGTVTVTIGGPDDHAPSTGPTTSVGDGHVDGSAPIPDPTSGPAPKPKPTPIGGGVSMADRQQASDPFLNASKDPFVRHPGLTDDPMTVIQWPEVLVAFAKASRVYKDGTGRYQDRLSLLPGRGAFAELETYTAPLLGTTVAISTQLSAIHQSLVVIAWKGTSVLQDVATDLDFQFTPAGESDGYFVPAEHSGEAGRVHRGFDRACRTVESEVVRMIRTLPSLPRNTRIVFTGHSLGGAIALLSSLRTRIRRALASKLMDGFITERNVPIHVITFGMPRAINADMRDIVENVKGLGVQRFVCRGDPIPLVPTTLQDYAHIGIEFVMYDRGGTQVYIGDKNIQDQTYVQSMLSSVVNATVLLPGWLSARAHGRDEYQTRLRLVRDVREADATFVQTKRARIVF